MKKFLPYIIGIIVIIALGAIIILGSKKAPRKMDERITLQQKDKIPYGTSVAKTLLPSMFPNASVFYDERRPGNWDSLTPTTYNQAVILIAKDFDADDEELNELLNFAKEGNYVFIISKSLSLSANNFFNFSYRQNEYNDYLNPPNDSLWMKLQKPFFASDQFFIYPGKKYESTFYSLDTLHCNVLGRNKDAGANFVQFKTGNGRIFIHLAPLAFSNYFILHKNNIEYYEKVFSLIPKNVNKIVWNEYYLTKPIDPHRESEPDMFRVLMNYPAFKWGLLTAIFMLLLFVLLSSRRRQRMIPAYEKSKNDSLDFVKTLGRLYYDRRDHQNLSKKMGAYFLEHIRSTYKLPTHTLDDNFIETLHYKSGYSSEKLKNIVLFIIYLDQTPPVSENQLSQFHKQLELFYQNT